MPRFFDVVGDGLGGDQAATPDLHLTELALIDELVDGGSAHPQDGDGVADGPEQRLGGFYSASGKNCPSVYGGALRCNSCQD